MNKWGSALLLSVSLLDGCIGSTDVWVHRQRLLPADGAGGQLTVLVDFGSGPTNDTEKREQQLSACIAKNLRATKLDPNVVSPDEFRRAALAGSPSHQTIQDPEILTQLLADTRIQERIAGLNLHYVVAAWERSETTGSLLPPAVATNRRETSRKSAHLRASLFDVKRALGETVSRHPLQLGRSFEPPSTFAEHRSAASWS
ncbi:MAG: hypothetical protein U0587_11850 [Candidatus Binatia bacterium]